MPDFKYVKGELCRFNGCNDPCDVSNGPCACGAWHKPDEDSGYQGMTMREFTRRYFDVVITPEVD